MKKFLICACFSKKNALCARLRIVRTPANTTYGENTGVISTPRGMCLWQPRFL